MINDAIVPVSCDGEGCGAQVEIEPSFVYSSYSGRDGRYDTSEEAIEAKIIREGWSAKNGKHYCEDCTSMRGEK